MKIKLTHVTETFPAPLNDDEDYCPEGESTSVEREYTFRELIDLISDYPDASSSRMTGSVQEWFSRHDQDFRTGEYITESIHYAHGQDSRSAKYWRRAILAK